MTEDMNSYKAGQKECRFMSISIGCSKQPLKTLFKFYVKLMGANWSTRQMVRKFTETSELTCPRL